MKKIEICDRCKREFYRQFVSGKNHWSWMNTVDYWTDGKGWSNYKILCRSCLKDWKSKHTDEFRELVSAEKKQKFSSYLKLGVLNQRDLV